MALQKGSEGSVVTARRRAKVCDVCDNKTFRLVPVTLRAPTPHCFLWVCVPCWQTAWLCGRLETPTLPS